MKESNYQHLDEYLKLYPFPQNIVDAAERVATWDQYRKNIIEECGVVIFVFGNKSDSGTITDADGVFKEFEIARQKGKIVIPIGITGGASKKLFDAIASDYDAYFGKYPDTKNLFFRLGNNSTPLADVPNILSEILKTIIGRS